MNWELEDITIQIVCSEQDKGRVRSHLHAYFPTIIIRDSGVDDFGFSRIHDIAIADFGLNDEYMRPITQTDSFMMLQNFLMKEECFGILGRQSGELRS